MKTVIRPGILVALKSRVSGGVSYQRLDIEKGADRSKWETTKLVEDPEEHNAATKARGAALGAISKLCSKTTFGLLCPLDSEAALDAAVIEARAIVRAHNDKATFTKVEIYILKGQIASSDEEAARAIGQEVASLVAEMSAGIDKLDAGSIREAANKARELSAMLGEEQQQAVNGAIEAARKAARQIVKRIEKDGEQAAIVLADIQRGSIEKARMAFLDLEDAGNAEALPAHNAQRFADLDMEKGN